ncbi:hypothetical protein JQX13_36025 [Archangium violaceum]|uniref:hypothetical protein n=1 Tax=Archangium violaceum TaxID=83451 RepID=UPI00193C1C10|nr:hypothetical protein [Archangium violaceum]QRK05533.1 hypothetical protein JQX13_36025 [Archangium violaceum]
MVIKSTSDIGLHILRGLAGPLGKLGDDYSVPLLAKQADGLPWLLGTGWFFRCEQEWFLVTAGHVLMELSTPKARRAGAPNDLDLLVPGVGDVLVPLSGRMSTSQRYDVGILWLKDPTPIRERWTPVTVADLAPLNDPSKAWYHVTGWPRQLSKSLTGGIGAKQFRFTAKFDAGTEPHDPGTEILFPLHRNDFGTFDGEPDKHPSLQGISGAPVWQIFTDDNDNGRYAPRLAGVQISYLERGTIWYIRATRWGAVRLLIEHVSPGLFSSAERLVGL